MRHLHNITIIATSLVFFTSCQINRTHVKRYYSKLNDQTVFVETLNTARAASCDQSQTSLEENGDMCAELLANLPDIHSTFVGTGTFVKHSGKIRVLTAEHVCHADEIPDTMEQEGVVIKIDKTSSITIKSQLFSSSAKIIKTYGRPI